MAGTPYTARPDRDPQVVKDWWGIASQVRRAGTIPHSAACSEADCAPPPIRLSARLSGARIATLRGEERRAGTISSASCSSRLGSTLRERPSRPPAAMSVQGESSGASWSRSSSCSATSSGLVLSTSGLAQQPGDVVAAYAGPGHRRWFHAAQPRGTLPAGRVRRRGSHPRSAAMPDSERSRTSRATWRWLPPGFASRCRPPAMPSEKWEPGREGRPGHRPVADLEAGLRAHFRDDRERLIALTVSSSRGHRGGRHRPPCAAA